MIPSAVVVPDEPAWPPSPSLKRRQSSLSSDSSKRPRLDTNIPGHGHGSSPRYSGVQSPSAERRKLSALGSTVAEEKKRGQRLFGALLGNLSQTSAKPAHRRRDEIEKRQQDKLRLKDEELAEEKRKRRAQIDVERKEEQKTWDEESMRIRHANMQATAHFLRTKTEPPLYYKPWEVRPAEEDIIKIQLDETEATIQRELAEHAARKGADTGINEVPPPVSGTISANTEDHQQPEPTEENKKEPKSELTDTDITNNQHGDHRDEHDTAMTMDEVGKPDVEDIDQKSHKDDARQQLEDEKLTDDHGGEELVEGQEDDVIY